jgi:signal transduction histidine kinase
VPVIVNAAPLRGPNGAIDGGVVALLDISALTELEQQREAFLAAVSHDLKNPLSAIRGQAMLLQRRASRLDPEAAQPFVDGLSAVDRSVQRITSLIDELLDVAHLQAGRPLDLDCQPMDLVALARQVIEEHQASTDRHQIEVAAETGELVGEWDRARLERVLDNLVANAVKYSPNGGLVQVEIGREEPNGTAQAVLRVRDRGVGIPSDELPKVFDRFYRGSNVAGRFQGTGIGLAGARQIVEQHGGQIAVESREQQGSTFTVRLPLNGCPPDA